MPTAADQELAEFVSQFYADPLGFVQYCYPWGEPGPLEQHAGPDDWQAETLAELGESVRTNAFNGRDAVPAVRESVSSGHGTGKTARLAWIVNWIMSTRPHCKGTITANTFTQLETKTWAEIQRWTKLCLTSHWFTVTTQRMYHSDFRESWFCAPQSCREENSEAFAGQHAADSTSFYAFDEASAIPDKIFDVAEGGLTDGEPMIFLQGNCTRSTGKFHRVTFGAERTRWRTRIIDSRESRFTNKQQIAEWIQDYGEDSDFVRVRVRGLPPRASDAQFIDQERVLQAQTRQVAVLPDEALLAGADLAWGGEDDNVIRFRRGADARSVPPIRIRGEFTRDPSVLTNRLADVLSREWGGQRVHTLFLDAAGIAGPIGSRLRSLGFKNVIDVNFGAHSPDPQCRFMRDHMWQAMKQWLITGAIDKDPQLEADLTGPGLRPENQQRIWLEAKADMKARGLDSPDDADALALTFAQPVKARVRKLTDDVTVMPTRGEMAWGMQ
jgi:hypothetical protein